MTAAETWFAWRWRLRHPMRATRRWWRDLLERRLRRRGWPADLLKAVDDQPWEYACRLDTGEVFFFEGARLVDPHGRWVTLVFRDKAAEGHRVMDPTRDDWPCSFERGLTVRVDRIVWVADAPHGS